MLKHTRTAAALVASSALLAIPATGVAGNGHGNANSNGHGSSHSCQHVKKVGYSVRGTLVSYTADDATTTDVNEAAVMMTVTGANSHARKSGELTDQDLVMPGTQIKGGSYAVTAADDAFVVKLNGYEGADTPSPGDKVKVNGRIPLTKKRCAPADTSIADRYGEPNVKKVTLSDRDLDAPVVP